MQLGPFELMSVKSWVLVALSLLSMLQGCRMVDGAGLFNVKDYGAGGSGDSAPAFVKAFNGACLANGGTVLVPSGVYMVQPFAIQRCKNIVFQVEGTINAPAAKSQWNNYKALGKGKGWIQFDWMESLTIVSSTGAGVFDGKASTSNWWGTGSCPIGLSFTHCQNLILRGFTVRNSPGTHVQVDLQMVEGQQGLLAEQLTIDSDAGSPNTDGLHLSHLWNGVVRNSKIGCGDDCVVMQTDCKNVLVEGIACGPGNGISLGSLGNRVDSCMNNILVQKCTFTDTQNGVRIKAWPKKGGGAATGVTFRDLTMVNVKRPIIVSQCYSGGTAKLCTGDGMSVAVYDVLFERIRGTCYKNQNCITVSCLGGTPCVGIIMRDINLGGAAGVCNAAYGKETNVSPGGCLQAGQPPAAALATAATRIQKCSYGTNGYYTTSGPGAPGSALRGTTPTTIAKAVASSSASIADGSGSSNWITANTRGPRKLNHH